MDPLRDINELLTTGYFKTARGRSPAKAEERPSSSHHHASSFLQAHSSTATYPRSPSRSRNHSRAPRTPPPPRPIVEEEAASLAKEQHGDVYLPNHDEPPLRGIIEQNPIILEADVTEAEAARLHEIPPSKEEERNNERRFVFVPREDTGSENSEEDVERRKQRKRDERRGGRREIPVREKKDVPPLKEVPPLERRKSYERTKAPASNEMPSLERRKSRQDLPSLETKVPREIPPQFRRSTSAYGSHPQAETPKEPARTPAGEYFLSPEAMRGTKDQFMPSHSAPRYNTGDFGGRASPHTDKRHNGSLSNSRPVTPASEKRQSTTSDSGRRSRRNSIEKPERLTRPQKLSEEFGGRRSDRPPLPERKSTAQSSRSSTHKYDSSTDDEITDSDSDRRRRKHRSNNLHPADNGHLRSSSKSNNTSRPINSSSRYSSPLPSPKSPSQFPTADNFERSGTFPVMRKGNSRSSSPNGQRDQKLNPFEFPSNTRPASRHSSQSSFPIPIPMPIPMPMPMPMNPMESVGSLPIPIPSRVDFHPPAESRRHPSMPQYDDDDRSSTVRPVEKPMWQPPKFEPPTHLDQPVGSYRRYSEDIERGSVAPLPTCPRKDYVRGRNDWLTLPQCPEFDICPSCYESTMAPTEFRHMFIPSPHRSPDTEIICDFGSSPWYRIAWLLTLKERRRDLNLFYGLAKVASSISPCLGDKETMRQWYSILDPKTNSPIRNFDVCYNCVRSIEVLLPAIRGVFIPTDVHATSYIPRVCDLRFNSKRFVKYFDALETTADSADPYSPFPPDTRSLASLVRRYSLIEECQRDIDLRDARWHIITQLPEFTVCPECFDDVVWPEVLQRKAIPLMFNKSVQRLPRASCQLYSERMRNVFRMAVERDDYSLLVGKVRERRRVEGGWKAEVRELRRVLAASNGGGGGGKVVDGGNRRVEEEIKRLEEEWRAWE